jgi:hypothetical protein
MLAQVVRRYAVPVFVRMKNSNEMAVVTDGVRGEESAGTLQVFDAKGSLVGRFHNVQEWYVGQARPLND